MKKLHLLIIKTYIGPLVITFIITVFVLLMQFLWKYIDDLVGKGLDTLVLAELLFYASVSFIPMALPLAILLSSLMTFGNLGEHYELVALKSSGISLTRIMRPLILLSVLISFCAFFYSNYVLPYTNLKMRSLLYDVQNKRPELNIKPGIFYKGIDGYSIKIGEKDTKSNILKRIMIYDHKTRFGNHYVTVADSGIMSVSPDNKYLTFTLYYGCNYSEITDENRQKRNNSFPFRRDRFEEETIVIELSGFGLVRTDEALFKNHYEMLNLNQLVTIEDSLQKELENRRLEFSGNFIRSNILRNSIQVNNPPDSLFYIAYYDSLSTLSIKKIFNRLTSDERLRVLSVAANLIRSGESYLSSTVEEYEARQRYINRHKMEFNRKFTLSIACLILFFIGAPLGSIIRKGGLGMPVVVSVLFFIFYYVIDISGQKFVKQDILPVYQGMWLSSFVLFPLGVFLTYKATKDSPILNTDTYFRFFRKIFRYLRRGKEVTGSA